MGTTVSEAQLYLRALKAVRELVQESAGLSQQLARAGYRALEASWDWSLGRHDEARDTAAKARRILDEMLAE